MHSRLLDYTGTPELSINPKPLKSLLFTQSVQYRGKKALTWRLTLFLVSVKALVVATCYIKANQCSCRLAAFDRKAFFTLIFGIPILVLVCWTKHLSLFIGLFCVQPLMALFLLSEHNLDFFNRFVSAATFKQTNKVQPLNWCPPKHFG